MSDIDQWMCLSHHTQLNADVQGTLALAHQSANIRYMDIKEIGQTVREIREAKRLTIVKVAEESGYDRGNLSKFETGKQGISVEALGAIADAMGVPITDFFAPRGRKLRTLSEESEKLLALYEGATQEGKAALMQIAQALPKA